MLGIIEFPTIAQQQVAPTERCQERLWREFRHIALLRSVPLKLAVHNTGHSIRRYLLGCGTAVCHWCHHETMVKFDIASFNRLPKLHVHLWSSALVVTSC